MHNYFYFYLNNLTFFYLINLKPIKLFFNLFVYFKSLNNSLKFFKIINTTGHIKLSLKKFNLKRLFYQKFQFTDKIIWHSIYINWFKYYFNLFYFFNLNYTNTQIFNKFKTRVKFTNLFYLSNYYFFIKVYYQNYIKIYTFFKNLVLKNKNFIYNLKLNLVIKPIYIKLKLNFLNKRIFYLNRALIFSYSNIFLGNLNFNNKIYFKTYPKQLFILPMWGYIHLYSTNNYSHNNYKKVVQNLILLNNNASLFIKLYKFRLYIFKKYIFTKKKVLNKKLRLNKLKFLNIYNNSFKSDSIKNFSKHSSLLSLNYKKYNLLNFSKFNNFFFRFFDNYPNILRLKFKPGYSIIWRIARQSFKKIFHLNFKYQHKLTKYILMFNKISGFTLLKKFELNILNILIRSRFFLNFNVIQTFINNNFIWINGFQVNNIHFQLYLNDFIQINISWKYFIYFKWLLNLSKLKFNKINWKYNIKLFNLKYRIKKFKMIKAPKWIESNIYLYLDIPNYLEVDFLSLSIYIIYEPYNNKDINNLYLQFFSFNIMNLYNWKYIT
jgi:hypothetical protein